MDKVLDLDLDFFVWPITHNQIKNGRLPDDEWTNLFSEEQVRQFLEQRCHLSKDRKILGHEVVEHQDAFRIWLRWLKEQKITAPFHVVHVDAHSDLGAGVNLTCHCIESELLALPLESRSEPIFGPKGLNSGNYLVFSIANRWIGRLTYVYPTDPKPLGRGNSDDPSTAHLEKLRRELGEMSDGDDFPPPVSDLPPWCFRNGDWQTGMIELVHRRPEDFVKRDSVPVRVEPSVPFELGPYAEFESSGFTHMLVAQSPQYTPAAADRLLAIIREYFETA